MLDKDLLTSLYITDRLSSAVIANQLNCSTSKVNYWITKYGIPKRTISDAIYIKHNPNGDPFMPVEINTSEKAMLYGMGMGLYWGEGTKANEYSIRLGNSDPELIKTFMRFLIELYGVDKDKLKFGLQVFSDLNPERSLEYWTTKLKIKPEQFYKIHITPSRSIGTYRKKSKHGVVTIYYHNKKLRDIIVNALPMQ